MNQTYFLYDEKTFWYTTRDSVLFFPPSDALQPLTALGHVENAETKRRFLSLVQVSGLMDELKTEKSTPITYEQAHLVHTQSHLDRLIELSNADGGDAGYDAPFGRGGYDYARVSAGLVAHGLDIVLSNKDTNAYALSRPPGHHAVAEQGIGFCLLANIPIAIEMAKQTRPDLRVAVIDWDVHHGNGTQDIFYNRNDVLAISLHQDSLFPRHSGPADAYGDGDGRGYTMNIPLPAGTGDGGYAYAMQTMVKPAIEQYQPDVIIVASGYDASGQDPLGCMMLSSRGFVTMTQMVKDMAKTLNINILMTHEGGYCPVYTPVCAQKTLETLADSSIDIEDEFAEIWGEIAGATLQPHQKQAIDTWAKAHPLFNKQ